MGKKDVRRKTKAKKISTTIDAWSYSRWGVYDKCKLKAKYKIIDRVPTETSPAMERGNDVHSSAENYIHAECGGTLHEALIGWEADFLVMWSEIEEANEWGVEEQWAFTNTWERTEWFAPDVWVRIKQDVYWYRAKTGWTVDYKTGKIREDEHEEQAELYAVGMYVKFPHLISVEVAFWYIDQEVIHSYEYKKKDLVKLLKKWNNRGKEITTAVNFPAEPGVHCRWCDFRASNGGPCRHA